MVPIPQYPLYSGTIRLYRGNLAGYYLDEEKDWSLDIKHLQEVYKSHYDKGQAIKALVLINPGNPTGSILSRENIVDVIKFCKDYKLVLLSDEVYQTNIYSEVMKFHSTKSVMLSMSPEYRDTMLFSFHSTSKGFYGE